MRRSENGAGSFMDGCDTSLVHTKISILDFAMLAEKGLHKDCHRDHRGHRERIVIHNSCYGKIYLFLVQHRCNRMNGSQITQIHRLRRYFCQS